MALSYTIDIRVTHYNDALSLPYYREELRRTNPARFPYMDDDVRAKTRGRLLSTLALLRCVAQEHLESKRLRALTEVADEIQQCLGYLEALDKRSVGEQQQIDQLTGAPLPLSCYGLCAMQDIHYVTPPTPDAIREEADAFIAAIRHKRTAYHAIDTIKGGIGAFNMIRLLHWVWGASMDLSLLAVLAREGIRLPYAEAQLRSYIQTLSTAMGFISGGLYGFRLLVELGEAIQVAFAHYQPKFARTGFRFFEPDGEEERQHRPGKRLWQELGKRKYLILNDLIWGGVNTATWLWLAGSLYTPTGGVQPLGFAGGVLTLALLVFDIGAGICSYLGKEADYLAQKAALGKHITALKKQNTPDAKAQLADRERMLKKLNLDWQYEESKCKSQIAGSTAWLVGWAALCSFFIPALPGMVFIALAASVWLFGSTIIKGIVDNRIESAKFKEVSTRCEAEAQGLLEAFTGASDDQKKNLYLQIKDLLAENKHDQKMVTYLRNKVIAQTILHAITPVIFFATTVFLPMNIAWIPIAIFLGLAYVINKWLEKFKPAEYQAAASLKGPYQEDFALLCDKEEPTLDDFRKTGFEEAEVIPNAQGYVPIRCSP